jgi:hypothetical protein
MDLVVFSPLTHPVLPSADCIVNCGLSEVFCSQVKMFEYILFKNNHTQIVITYFMTLFCIFYFDQNTHVHMECKCLEFQMHGMQLIM